MMTTVPTSASSTFDKTASTLLQHHLSRSPIEADEDGIPFANPSPDLRFSSFVSLFSPTDQSYLASLFRLGHALFDDIDLRLGDSVADIRNRITTLHRKATLSAWLEDAVAPAVESDLKDESSTGSTSAAYILLTGNQIEKASERAMEAGNMKLATLISQGGGDLNFREDLLEQLHIWREQRVDVHIDDSIRKVYAWLAGTTDILEGSKGTGLERCADVDLLKGLDWKRTFGFHMWFSEPLDATIGQVFQSYNQLRKQLTSRVTPPLPWYIESPSTMSPESPWRILSPPVHDDALFSLIRLHAEPACSLSRIFTPLSFGPSPVDYSILWHLYILLSRCIRVRDFADRGDPGVNRDMEQDEEEEFRVEGHSPSADLLASSYAFQLEGYGMIQEALFVLLHIEGSVGFVRFSSSFC
jgi:nuclear pore complex protein Nup98-Nup96